MNDSNVSLLNWLDYDGRVTRFVVGLDVGILSVYPDGFCIYRKKLVWGDESFHCFYGLDVAMNYIIDCAFLDSLREE